jgi:hypothetical protein
MFKDEYTEQARAEDKEALFQTFRKFVEGTIVHGDYNISLETIAEDVVGIGMGEQGYYTNKSEIRKLFEESSKAPANGPLKNTVEYDEIGIRIFSPVSATITGKVHIITEINGKSVKNGIMQMASAKKENGEWLFCLLTVAPLVLTEESIEAYPLAFADETLTKLKADIALADIEEKKRIKETLKRREEMLNALNKMSVTLLAHENKPFEEIISNGLLYITNVVGIDHVSVYRHLGGETPLKQIYLW